MVTSRSIFFLIFISLPPPSLSLSLRLSASISYAPVCAFLPHVYFVNFVIPSSTKKRSTRAIAAQKIIVCWKNINGVLVLNFCGMYFCDVSYDSSSGNRLRCTNKSGRRSLCTCACYNAPLRCATSHFATSRLDCFIVISDYLSTRMQSVR